MIARGGLLVGLMPMKDRARHSSLANYRERVGGASVRRMQYQRQIHRGRERREACERPLRRIPHACISRAHPVPWQSDFADGANRVALTRDRFEHVERVMFGMFKLLGMKSHGRINDARILSPEFDYPAIGRGPDSRHHHGRYSRIIRPLDCAARVGILVSVEMNVAVDHFIRIAGMRRVRIASGVPR